jgi:glycine cleavage system H protein
MRRCERRPFSLSLPAFSLSLPLSFCSASTDLEFSMTIKYTPEHEWVRLEADGTVTVGITAHAQDALGDVVFVELPAVGTVFSQKDTAGVVESVKAAADVYVPMSGEITAGNEALVADPSLANTDPQGSGWFFKMRLSEPAQFEALLDQAAYDKLLQGA